MLRIFHLLASHDTEKPTGVPRFSGYFQQAFPEAKRITPESLVADINEGDVVVTDNHLSLLVPANIPVVAAHHGCAPYHYEMDPPWRCPQTLAIAADQSIMLGRKNTTFVAPSKWTADRFADVARESGTKYNPVLIPHWVPLIEKLPRPERKVIDDNTGMREFRRPVVIGDWRNYNKGAEIWPKLVKAMPMVEFRPLNFSTEEEKIRAYSDADCYLCLSLSEGAPYSVADAEAASLPIVSTEVGNCYEFMTSIAPCRRDIDSVKSALEFAIGATRGPSFYASYPFEVWKYRWKEVIEKAAKKC